MHEGLAIVFVVLLLLLSITFAMLGWRATRASRRVSVGVPPKGAGGPADYRADPDVDLDLDLDLDDILR